MRKMKLYLLSIVACLALAVAGFADHQPNHKGERGGRWRRR